MKNVKNLLIKLLSSSGANDEGDEEVDILILLHPKHFPEQNHLIKKFISSSRRLVNDHRRDKSTAC